jgi:hypothetical protein
MLALPVQDVPSDSPAASRSAAPGTPRRRAEPRPARQRRRMGVACRDPPRATLLRPPDRWHKQASAPEPLVGPRRTLDRPVGTSRTSPWRAGHAGSPSGRPLAPSCGRRTLAWTPSPPISSSLRTTDSGWPGDGHGGPLDRPVGRTPPVHCDRPADGSGPGPDGGGQAADTSSAQRPTDHASGQLATANHAACTSWP